MGRPFDVDRLELTGDAVPALEDVAIGITGFAQFTVADNGTLLYRRGGAASGLRALVWVDRQGGVEPLAAELRWYGGLRLSPDGQRVGVTVLEANNIDVVIYDLARDGGPLNLYWKAADGTGEVERLTTAPNLQAPSSWSDDGRTLVLYEASPDTQGDAAVLSTDGAHETELLLKEDFTQLYFGISPDGRWMAYSSLESGRPEVYVRPFPNVDDGKWQISRDGGQAAIWGPDGRELFFRSLADASMMVAPVDTEPTFSPGNPTVLFEAEGLAVNVGGPRAFDISSDGQRFLMVSQGATTDETSAASGLVVVEHWLDELTVRLSGS